jgi:hypothetical protein
MELCIALPSSAKANEARNESAAGCARSVLITAGVLALNCEVEATPMEVALQGAEAPSAVVLLRRGGPYNCVSSVSPSQGERVRATSSPADVLAEGHRKGGALLIEAAKPGARASNVIVAALRGVPAR